MTDPNVPAEQPPAEQPHDVHAGGNPDPAAPPATEPGAQPLSGAELRRTVEQPARPHDVHAGGNPDPAAPAAPAPDTVPPVLADAQPHLAVAAGDELPPLVTVTENNEIAIDFQGALEHIPDCVLNEAQRVHATEGAVVQLKQRVGSILAERAAQDLARDILALTGPEPEIIETAGGGETLATPPGAVE